MAKVGIEHNGVFVGAMRFPDRKKPCIVVERGNQCVVIGSFIDADRVDLFEQALRDMLAEPENANRCVCCGEIIPEGRQVCPRCERSRT